MKGQINFFSGSCSSSHARLSFSNIPWRWWWGSMKKARKVRSDSAWHCRADEGTAQNNTLLLIQTRKAMESRSHRVKTPSDASEIFVLGRMLSVVFDEKNMPRKEDKRTNLTASSSWPGSRKVHLGGWNRKWRWRQRCWWILEHTLIHSLPSRVRLALGQEEEEEWKRN